MADTTARSDAGLFLVLEGADGSGKTTQFKLLSERLKAVGYDVEVFDFPRYDLPSSHFVRRYLNGEYGPASTVSPYTASLFYAMDRYEAAPAIRRALSKGKVVLSNRYVGSNMAHQGSKLATAAEQRGFFVWGDSLEFHLLGIPRPDLNIFLRVPAEVSFELIGRKESRKYTQKSHDEHEADIDHLRRSVATYDLLTQLFPKDFLAIDSTHEGRLLDVPTINDKIWEAIQPLLPSRRPKVPQGKVVRFNTQRPPEASKSSTSRPAEIEPKPRPIDKSERVEINVSNVSLLAASFLEGNNSLEINSTDGWSEADTKYYYYPLNLPRQLKTEYEDAMKRLIELHQHQKHEFKQARQRRSVTVKPSKADELAVLEAITPMSAQVSLHLNGDPEGLAKLSSKLASASLEEADWLSQQLEEGSTRKNNSLPPAVKDEETTNPGIPESLQETIARFARSRLTNSGSANNEPVQLLNYWPKNEFETLIDGIYPHTNLSRGEIAGEIDEWKYEQKNGALRAVASQDDHPALDQVRYHWDIICDRLTLRELARQGLVKDLQVQPATIRYGYEVPEVIEKLRLEDPFLESFDLSLKIFSSLQTANREDLAGYVTLQGHKLRAQFNLDIPSIHLALKSQGSKSYQELLTAITEKIREVHPVIGATLAKPKADHRSSDKPSSHKLGARATPGTRQGRKA